jgi:leucyl/phenylalanyl-tRNA--protein transferase
MENPNGLLAAGGDLSAERLLQAYRQGIFPWYSPGDPILWWSPDPRMVLYPPEIRVTRSLAKVLRNRAYEVRFDTAFERVMSECAAPRAHQQGTWITPELHRGYSQLHAMGYAHSMETWIDGELAGGLYGVALGRVFFGESMFTRVRDASKIAFAHGVRFLEAKGFQVIDCQMHTDHLASLGARLIPRAEFLQVLRDLVDNGEPPGAWSYVSRTLDVSGTP